MVATNSASRNPDLKVGENEKLSLDPLERSELGLITLISVGRLNEDSLACA